MIYLGVFSALLAIAPGSEILTSYAHSTNNITKANTYLAQVTNDKNQSETTELAKKLASQIDLIKLNLIKATNPDSKKIIQADGNIDYFEIENKDLVMLSEIVYKAGLDEFISEFEKFQKLKTSSEPNISRLVSEINQYLVPKQHDEDPVIVQLPFITLLNVISDWQNKFLLISYMQGLKST
jgi:hypothetical protein